MKANSGLPVTADNGLVNTTASLGFLYTSFTPGELLSEWGGWVQN